MGKIGTGRREDGATAVEYALILVGVAAVLVALIVGLGDRVFGLLDTSYQTIVDTVAGSSS